jgi:hypothetical protein
MSAGDLRGGAIRFRVIFDKRNDQTSDVLTCRRLDAF